MTYTLRPYQQNAVDAALRQLKGGASNAIEVLPTGSGKSLVIANIAKQLGAPVLIFQPSKEILEQNLGKLLSYGFHAEVFSASMGRKAVSDITFATIGSAIKQPDLFKDFRFVIVDECHGVNPKGGMYASFLARFNSGVLGLTATPYRLVTDGYGGSILKFLTRTRPRIFSDVVYCVQNGDLFRDGYLAPLRYTDPQFFDRRQLRLNSTGADFDDLSVRNYYRLSGFNDRLVETVRGALARRRNALVFTRFVEESSYVAQRVPGAAIVTAETPARDRERIISDFRAGRVRVVCNVGVLTTGFDYPELETAILARPTMSLALYYQMIGRIIRPHPSKAYGEVIDLCANGSQFGRIEDLRINPGRNGKWFVESKGKPLTNVYFGSHFIPGQAHGQQLANRAV
jgi:DNA repair protein RadD